MTRPSDSELTKQEDRLDQWQNLVNSTYGETANVALRDGAFHGRLNLRPLGQILFTHISSTPIQYHRGPVGSQTDCFFISLTLCPEAYLEQGGCFSTQSKGDIVMYDGARAYTCTFPQGDDQLVLAVPRSDLLHHIPSAENLLCRTLPANTALGALAGNLMQQTLCAGELPAKNAHRLGESVLDVLANAFELTFGNNGAGSHQSLQLNRIKSYILDNLANPELSLATTAAVMNTSSRTVSRLFAEQGSTFATWTWRKRLDACRSALLRGEHRSITEVALSYGFSNMAHFSRAFRQAYGVAPSQVKR